MVTCPKCGRRGLAHQERCMHCGTLLADDSEGTGDDVEASDAADASGTGDVDTAESDHLSRRAMLGYTGGAAGAVFAGVGAGWFFFVRDPLGPEVEVVEEYIDALDRSHFNTILGLYHRSSPGTPPTPEEYPQMEDRSIALEDAEIETRQEESDVEAVEELALVVATVSVDTPWDDEETIPADFIVARNPEDEWKIFRAPHDIEE